MSEPKRTQFVSSADDYDEPVFAAAQADADEPYFAPVPQSPPAPAYVEPVFEAVPAQARGVSLPVDGAKSALGWEGIDDQPSPASARRLGRTTPLWAALSLLALLLLVALWFLLGKRAPDEPVLPTVPASGVIGSALLTDAGGQLPTPEATAAPATAAPETRLSPGMRVAVGNTNGQGIRLRATPGTAGQTLGIYNDGAPFLVLSPGGDYGDYPVQADGYFWYRIRVVKDPADQLVGWAVGDFLVNSEQ